MLSAEHLNCLIQSAVAGAFFGFVVAVPVGPVNLTVINDAVCKGFLPAFLAGVGAMVAETIYAALMLAGHSSILDRPAVMHTMQGLAVVIIAYLGIRSVLARTEQFEQRSAAVAKRAEERWHHPKTFLVGFVLTISNLGILLLWGAVASYLLSHEWVQPSLASRSACAGGVFLGGVLWFFLLAFCVSRAHRRVKPHILMRLVRGCGVVFLIIAGLLAYRLVVPSRKPHGVDLLHHAP